MILCLTASLLVETDLNGGLLQRSLLGMSPACKIKPLQPAEQQIQRTVQAKMHPRAMVCCKGQYSS